VKIIPAGSPRASSRTTTAGPAWVMDAWLVVMVLIWGINYSVIKRCFEEIPPQPFNALRLIIATAVFHIAIRTARRRAHAGGVERDGSTILHTHHDLTRRDRLDLLWLGLIGHCAYQFCFVGGVAITSVSNAALIIGATPVVIATGAALLGHERIRLLHWVGAAVSLFGIYFVVGHGASFGGPTFKGDLLVIVSTFCWAAYTLGATRLMSRHSPLFVTGTTMAIGMGPYVLLSVPGMLRTDWAGVSTWTWTALVLSALLALCAAYLIWYAAVQRIGAARTSVYSNVVPIVAMAGAALWLGEPITRVKAIGAAAVLGGVFLTRLARRIMT
jgi:drug/metabolite transporter (DMT)-like permease